jgi:hypothetical protein
MSQQHTPSANWWRMHQGRGVKPKRRYRTWLGAWRHMRLHQRRLKIDADYIQVYPCWFTDQNTFGPKHYHVGHMPGYRKRMSGPVSPGKVAKGVLYVGVFATDQGFQVRQFDTKPATSWPVQPTVQAALTGYLDGLEREP